MIGWLYHHSCKLDSEESVSTPHPIGTTSIYLNVFDMLRNQKVIVPPSCTDSCMDLHLSVIERTSKPVGRVVLEMQDAGFEIESAKEKFFVMSDNPDRQSPSPVEMLVGAGPTGKTIKVPNNAVTRGWLKSFGHSLENVNINRPPKDRKQKEQAVKSIHTTDKPVIN